MSVYPTNGTNVANKINIAPIGENMPQQKGPNRMPEELFEVFFLLLLYN